MELETKIRTQQMKYQKKLKNLEELYFEQIEIQNKKIYNLEKADKSKKFYSAYTKKTKNDYKNMIEEDNFEKVKFYS